MYMYVEVVEKDAKVTGLSIYIGTDPISIVFLRGGDISLLRPLLKLSFLHTFTSIFPINISLVSFNT
jgi:hypothetical protein